MQPLFEIVAEIGAAYVKSLIPVLLDLVGYISDILPAVVELAAAFQDLFGAQMKSFAGLAAVVGPILKLMVDNFTLVAKAITGCVAILSTFLTRLMEGRLFTAGFFDEVDERINGYSSRAKKAPDAHGQTYAARQASYGAIGTAGTNLQIASLSMGAVATDYQKGTYDEIKDWRKEQDSKATSWINQLAGAVRGFVGPNGENLPVIGGRPDIAFWQRGNILDPRLRGQ
jgi:hypothetical protein